MAKQIAKIFSTTGIQLATIPVRMYKTRNGWSPKPSVFDGYDAASVKEFEVPPSIGGRYYVLPSKATTTARDDAAEGEDFHRYGVVDHYGQPANRWNGNLSGYLFDHINVNREGYRDHLLGSGVALVDGILEDFQVPTEYGHYIFNDGSTLYLRQKYISASVHESMAGMVTELFLAKQGMFEQEYNCGYGAFEFHYSN